MGEDSTVPTLARPWPPSPTTRLSSTQVALVRQLARGPGRAEPLASALGIHVTAARRHLRELVAARMVESRSGPTRRGRPPIVYALTDEGRELGGSGYGPVLNLLLDSMAASLKPAEVRRILLGTSDRLARAIGRPRDARSIVQALGEVGFEPELVTRRGRKAIISRNCPLLRAAKGHVEMVCETFHSGLLRALFGHGAPTLRSTLARGDPYCMHLLQG